jgi:tellurium resistance protein TerD
MWVTLSKIKPTTKEIHIWANVYGCSSNGQHFGMVPNAYIRIMNDRKEEMYRYNLTGSEYDRMTAMHFGSLYKHNGEWKFRAVGEGYNYKSISEIKQNNYM